MEILLALVLRFVLPFDLMGIAYMSTPNFREAVWWRIEDEHTGDSSQRVA